MLAPETSNSSARRRSWWKSASSGLALTLAGLVVAALGGPASAAPGPRLSASPNANANAGAVATGGASGIFGLFQNRDPLKKIEPNQVYRTKYGIMTGKEYEERVLSERVKSFDAALRAGDDSSAEETAVRRAKEVEKQLKKDQETAAAAQRMLESDAKDRAAAETVLKAASEQKQSRTPSVRSSSRPTFRKGISSYRAPTRDQPAKQEPLSIQEQPPTREKEPTQEQPAPIQEQPAPVQEKPAPVQEQPPTRIQKPTKEQASTSKSGGLFGFLKRSPGEKKAKSSSSASPRTQGRSFVSARQRSATAAPVAETPKVERPAAPAGSQVTSELAEVKKIDSTDAPTPAPTPVAKPTLNPFAKPAPKPFTTVAKPAAKPAAKPVAKSASKPAPKPAAKSVSKPATPPVTVAAPKRVPVTVLPAPEPVAPAPAGVDPTPADPREPATAATPGSKMKAGVPPSSSGPSRSGGMSSQQKLNMAIFGGASGGTDQKSKAPAEKKKAE